MASIGGYQPSFCDRYSVTSLFTDKVSLDRTKKAHVLNTNQNARCLLGSRGMHMTTIVVVVSVTKDSTGQSVGPAVQGPANVVVVALIGAVECSPTFCRICFCHNSTTRSGASDNVDRRPDATTITQSQPPQTSAK